MKPYYGESIRRQAEEVLEALGVRHAVVDIRDEGALPFVISARIEAAVRRAGMGEGTRVLPEQIKLPEASTRDRLRRSRLYVPGSEPKYFISAGLHAADGVILDLEDSVHPNEKDAARLLVRNALRAVDFMLCERMVRINQLPLGLKDLDEIVPESPDLILIPKVEHPEQVVEVGRRAKEIQADYGITRAIWLMPIIESATGIENAFAIAAASDRIVAVTIGLEDYTADLGVVKTDRRIGVALCPAATGERSTCGSLAGYRFGLWGCRRSRGTARMGNEFPRHGFRRHGLCSPCSDPDHP